METIPYKKQTFVGIQVLMFRIIIPVDWMQEIIKNLQETLF
jgi:hypothetical protein